VRIQTPYRSSVVTARGGVARAHSAAGGFAPEHGASVQRAQSTTPASALSDIHALLALQEADDPLRKRRKAVRRGQSMLDTLDEVKSDLLIGRVSEGRLNQLQMLVMQAREKTVPHLDALLDDIDLRVQVELAKLGRI